MNAPPLSVWVVDDDLNEHLLIGHAFKAIGAPNQVRFFPSAIAAQRALESAGPDELPHVILCDVKMPVMDGFQFLHWLRSSKVGSTASRPGYRS